jgi:hypothetical protein
MSYSPFKQQMIFYFVLTLASYLYLTELNYYWDWIDKKDSKTGSEHKSGIDNNLFKNC